MKPETEQLLGTLELLADKLSFDLPGHEDGGSIYPFAWDENKQGEFNIFNLCRNNKWLKLTDIDRVIKTWRQLEYPRYFNNFSLSPEKIKVWEDNIDSLELVIRDLVDLEDYEFLNSSYSGNSNIIIGQIDNSTWIGIAPTVYVETTIPHEVIARHTKHCNSSVDLYIKETREFDTKIKAIIDRLETIELNGDFGGGYYYSHSHKIVCALGKTKELAFHNTLSQTGMLEVSQFDGLYCDRQYFDDYYGDYNTNNRYQKYDRINQYLKQNFSDVKVYRLASWIAENIYILGEKDRGDFLGLHLESYFVYNP